jgi:hypothetical protein
VSKDKNLEFERPARPEDEIVSGWAELIRSKDYSDEELYPTSRLEAIGHFWMMEEDNPIRSPRGQAEAKHISKLAAFEVAWRTGRVQTLIDYYGGSDE